VLVKVREPGEDPPSRVLIAPNGVTKLKLYDARTWALAPIAALAGRC
jgi:hypothetical protein